VLNPPAPEWIGFHDEDRDRFQALLFIRHWVHGVRRLLVKPPELTISATFVPAIPFEVAADLPSDFLLHVIVRNSLYHVGDEVVIMVVA